MTKRLEKLLQTLSGHRIFIQTHNFPDPDALACALGMKNLLKHFDINAEICYKGGVSKASTNNMIKIFSIEMTDIDSIDDMNENDYVLTVDSQANNSNIAPSSASIVACIDHHPTVNPFDYKFRDVRICGACASLVAEYYFSNGIALDTNTATALLYGLKMDTEDFNRGVTDIDVEMYRRLFDLADNETIKQLKSQQMDFSELKAYTSALAGVKIFDDIAFSFIEEIVSDGLVASVCDFLLTLSQVNFAVVYGCRKNGLKFSVRSGVEFFDAGMITSNALEGIGTGGGHAAMAGGFVSFDVFKGTRLNIEEEIQNRFINAVYFSKTLQAVLTDPIYTGIPDEPDENASDNSEVKDDKADRADSDFKTQVCSL